MRFATYPDYVLQMIPSRPPVRLSRAPWVNNSTRATTQVPQAVEIRALTHPLKNLRTFSDGTVRRKMMNEFSRKFEADVYGARLVPCKIHA